MLRFLIQRLIQVVPVLIGVLLVVFLLVRLAGDPVRLMLGLEATPEQIAQVREQLGLDRPVFVQFGAFLKAASRLDFGSSLRHGTPAMELVFARLPATLSLAISAFAISLLIAVPLGVIAAVFKETWLDRLLTIGALAGQSIPSFWLGLMLILVLGMQWRILPVSGGGSLRHLILPAATLGAFSAALGFRLMRSTMIDVIGNDYVRTAKAKGLSDSNVVILHAARNALIPVVTVLALQFSALMGGAIVVESVFAYPGMGQLVVQAINNRDFPVVQSFVVLLALIVALINLGTDIFYSVLDPRVRYG